MQHTQKEFISNIKYELEKIAKYFLERPINVRFSDGQKKLPCADFLCFLHAKNGTQVNWVQELKNDSMSYPPRLYFQDDHCYTLYFDTFSLGIKWLEANEETKNSMIQADTVERLFLFAESINVTQLKEGCIAYINENVMRLMDFQPEKEQVNATKWRKWLEFSIQHNLPQLKQACIEAMSYIKCDLQKPNEVKELLEIAKFLRKHSLPDPLFSENGRYPPMLLISEDDEKKTPVNLPFLLHVSPILHNSYEMGTTEFIFGTSKEIELFTEWADMTMNPQGIEDASERTLISKKNWKELFILADQWEIEELFKQCEDSAPLLTIRSRNEELLDVLSIAQQVNSDALIKKILSTVIDRKQEAFQWFFSRGYLDYLDLCRAIIALPSQYHNNHPGSLVIQWINDGLERTGIEGRKDYLSLMTKLPYPTTKLYINNTERITSKDLQDFLEAFKEENPKAEEITIRLPDSSSWEVLQFTNPQYEISKKKAVPELNNPDNIFITFKFKQ